jgi:hypothetical protein
MHQKQINKSVNESEAKTLEKKQTILNAYMDNQN